MNEDINEVNFVAYENERLDLLKNYQGKYAAYSKGCRILIGDDEDLVYADARKLIPKGLILVQKIIPEDQEPIVELRTPSFGKLEQKTL